tara:strand:+ start:532 stop:840 length:309 start_codon:yes stop_codon:yes gene_type:complete
MMTSDNELKQEINMIERGIACHEVTAYQGFTRMNCIIQTQEQEIADLKSQLASAKVDGVNNIINHCKKTPYELDGKIVDYILFESTILECADNIAKDSNGGW